MEKQEEIWFTYEPIAHSDKGIIYCEGKVELTAIVTRSNFGNKFSIQYNGQRNSEIESILEKMNEWFFYTHIKDAEDNEF